MSKEIKEILARHNVYNKIMVKIEDMEDVDLTAFFNRNFGANLGANGDGTFFLIVDEPKPTLAKLRHDAAEAFYGKSDFGDYELIASNGWEDDGGYVLRRTLYVENPDGDSFQKTFTVVFKPGSDEIERADLDGNDIFEVWEARRSESLHPAPYTEKQFVGVLCPKCKDAILEDEGTRHYSTPTVSCPTCGAAFLRAHTSAE
jgi:predicted RNA-binding Zn-ribbon protein involved in translation (DUF1610 family)